MLIWSLLNINNCICRDKTTRIALKIEVLNLLLSYYLTNKQSIHIRSQGLKILMLIGEK